MQRYLAMIIALWVGMPGNPCHAAPTAPSDGPLSQPNTAETPPRTDDGNRPADPVAQAVEQRFAAAREAYKAGDLRGALMILAECYEATHAANLLFNIAQLHRELEECAPAVDHYRRYIAEDPDGERVEDAKLYLDLLRTRCEEVPDSEPRPASATQRTFAAVPASERDRVPGRPPAPDDSVSPRANYWAIIGWSALGAGALATAGTVFASIETRQARRDVDRLRTSDDPVDGHFMMERLDDFYRDRAWAFGLGAAAVVSVGVGVYALAVAAPRERAETHSFSTTILPDRTSLAYRLRF